MHRLTYPNDKKTFEREYIQSVLPRRICTLSESWKYLKANHHDKLRKFPDDVEEILTAPFSKLVEMRKHYSEIKDEKLTSEISSIFSYERHADKIRDFFKDHSQEMHIDTCPCCELSYIQVIHVRREGKKYQQYDLDHFISKSKYPITALSLYNLIPSCHVCNSNLKGQDDILEGLTPIEGKKLSPSSGDDYTFDEDVTIIYIPKTSSYSATIDFDCTNDIYERNIETFALRERYAYHTDIATALIEKRRKFPDTYIEMIARMIPFETKESIRDSLFGISLHKDHHHIMQKLYQDILPDIYKKEPNTNP